MSTAAPAAASHARRRWLVDSAAWVPADGEMAYLLSLLTQEEGEAVLAFKFEDDRKRAVISRLMARRVSSLCLGVPWFEVNIWRTRGRKPFCANSGRLRDGAPNFNFNISHEGDYVALASEPHVIVGVDVAAPQQLRRGAAAAARPLLDALAVLRQQLTDGEWERIAALAPDESAMEAAFQQAWGCKEAFVKARGDGLGFEPLSRIHSEVSSGAGANGGVLEARLTVDGAPARRWRVWLHPLPRRHWAAVALAPPEEVVDADGAFKVTLHRWSISDDEMAAHLALPPPPFELLRVVDLLPDDKAAQYEEFFGSG